jgi:hypothetical protein
MKGPYDYETELYDEGKNVTFVLSAWKFGEIYFSTDSDLYFFGFAFDGVIPESLIPGYIGCLPEQLVEGFNDLEKPRGCDRLVTRRITGIINHKGSVLVCVERV